MRWGILGTGGMGNVHARHLRRMSGIELLCFDEDKSKSNDFAGKYEAALASSGEDLIKQADIVDICLPSDLHFEYASKSIAASKATFVEKPLTKTLEEGAKLVNAAAKANVPLGVAHVVRFFPEFA